MGAFGIEPKSHAFRERRNYTSIRYPYNLQDLRLAIHLLYISSISI